MTDPILTAKQINKTFGGIVALNNLSFDIESEKITAVIGPNGAGKTTLINVLTGFLLPNSGTITLKGEMISGCRNHEVAYLGMARTFQTAQICDNMSVLENVMVGLHSKTKTGILSAALTLPRARREEIVVRKKAVQYLEMVGLDDIADQPASGIPIGNQRLLEIARALASQPELLLLDEPAAGLNTQETRTLGELIQTIKSQDITVIIVEHDMELVMDISDQIMVLNFGEIIAKGTPAEIQNNPEVIAVYLGDEE